MVKGYAANIQTASVCIPLPPPRSHRLNKGNGSKGPKAGELNQIPPLFFLITREAGVRCWWLGHRDTKIPFSFSPAAVSIHATEGSSLVPISVRMRPKNRWRRISKKVDRLGTQRLFAGCGFMLSLHDSHEKYLFGRHYNATF